MDKILEIVKIIVIFQVALISLFVVLMYLTRYYFAYRHQKNAEKITEIKQLFTTHLTEENSFSTEEIKLLRHNIQQVLVVVKELGKQATPQLLKQLAEQVFKPRARALATSRRWFKRFQAALCYSYGFDEQDKEKLKALLHDKSLLVAINAAHAVIIFNNKDLINTLITAFSTGRRLQQSTFAELVAKSDGKLIAIILQRLHEEKDPFIRVFCYRLLNRLPAPQLAMVNVVDDLAAATIDLKIAALEYLVHCKDTSNKGLFYSLANDPHWEVRAAVAKALTIVDDEQSLQLLQHLLSDSQWWVRINAAHSLLHHGKKGLQILQALTPGSDRFAYETAQAVLPTQGQTS